MIERCAHTDLRIPECSCRPCLVALIDRYAPHVRRVSNVLPLRKPGTMTGERQDERGVIRGVG